MVLDELSQQLKKSAEQQLMLLEDDSLSAAAIITPHDDNTTTTTTIIIVNIMDELLQQTIKNSAANITTPHDDNTTTTTTIIGNIMDELLKQTIFNSALSQQEDDPLSAANSILDTTTTNTNMIVNKEQLMETAVQLAAEDQKNKKQESLVDDDARRLLKTDESPLPSQIINKSDEIISSSSSSSPLYVVNKLEPKTLFVNLISYFLNDTMKLDEMYTVVCSLFKKGEKVYSQYIQNNGMCGCGDENYTAVYRKVAYSPLQISMLDFLSLGPKNWVESLVIDLYFSMLNIREISLSEAFSGRKKNFYYNSYFYEEMKNNKFSEISSLLGVNLSNYAKLFFPVHLFPEINHWILCEIQLNDNSILITSYDSKLSCKVDQKKVLSVFSKWIKEELNNLGNKYCDIPILVQEGTSIQQFNSDDCGVLVILNALFLSDDGVHSILAKTYTKGKLRTEIIPNTRYKIAMDIERGYINDIRLTSCYQIRCYKFKNKNTIKIKNMNQEMAELCAFVEGSKNKPIDLMEEDVVVNKKALSLSNNNNNSIKSQDDEYLIHKWRFESYKAKIIILSHVQPYYEVLPDFFNIHEPTMIKQLLDSLKRMEIANDPDFKVIAQHGNEKINDNKRFHYHPNSIKKLNKLPEIVKIFLNEITKSIKSVISNLPNIKPVDISILYSKNGCGKQKTHTDYDTSNEKDRELAKKSFFALFAIMDNTNIIVQHDADSKLEDREVFIPKGCLFFGRGDLIHAGSSYEQDNVRLHFYIDHVDAVNIDQNDRGTHFDYEDEEEEEIEEVLDHEKKVL
jgi:hypothetical protein